jgi:hypothetical protein
MLRYLRENWIWIAAPIVVVAVILLLVILLGGGDSTSPFIYNIF